VLVGAIIGIVVASHKSGSAPVHTVPTPEIAQVSITKDGFAPSTVTIKAGNIVEWTSSDDAGTHIVAANPLKVHSELPSLLSTQLGQGAIYRYKFTKAGTYHYHDEVNPQLNGTVIVK
jgi:plastocyanin